MSEYEIERKLQILKTALSNLQAFKNDNILESLQEFEHDDHEDMDYNFSIIAESAETISDNIKTITKCINTMQDILIGKEFSPYRFEPSYDDYRKAA